MSSNPPHVTLSDKKDTLIVKDAHGQWSYTLKTQDATHALTSYIYDTHTLLSAGYHWRDANAHMAGTLLCLDLKSRSVRWCKYLAKDDADVYFNRLAHADGKIYCMGYLLDDTLIYRSFMTTWDFYGELLQEKTLLERKIPRLRSHLGRHDEYD